MSFGMAAHALIGTAVAGSGAMALILNKGSLLHRLAGRLFVGSMLMMVPVIVAGALFTPGSISSLGILFVCFMAYLAVSAWSTISTNERPPASLDLVAPVVALCIFVAGLVLGWDAVSTPGEGDNLPPQEAYWFFAVLAFTAMLLDMNNLRLGGVRGRHRIVRHVWRMSCALFFAISTLFTGPGSIVFPEVIRGNPMMSVPQFLVVITALFWIYRLLFSKQQSFLKNEYNTCEPQDPTNF